MSREVEKEFEVIFNPLTCIAIPEEKHLIKVILENNTSFSTWRECQSQNIIVRCINKPRDMPLYSIKFKEVEI